MVTIWKKQVKPLNVYCISDFGRNSLKMKQIAAKSCSKGGQKTNICICEENVSSGA